jgi:hypothetical protein
MGPRRQGRQWQLRLLLKVQQKTSSAGYATNKHGFKNSQRKRTALYSTRPGIYFHFGGPFQSKLIFCLRAFRCDRAMLGWPPKCMYVL